MNNQNLPDIKEIKEPSILYWGILFPKYSPLAPIFSRFGAQSFENGLYDRLFAKWFGNGVPPPRPVVLKL